MDLSSLALSPRNDEPGGAAAAAATDVEESLQLVHHSSGTIIYRLEDTGIKLLVDPNPTPGDILKLLMHERNISIFLPTSCRKRNVFDVKGFRGYTAAHFKWVKGITLKEWMSKAQRRPDVDLIVRLRVAIAIVETLVEFHNGSVVYNNLTPDNIILDMSEGSYVATFIDLSAAIALFDRDEAFIKSSKEADLKDLGILLNELFMGEKASFDCGQQEDDDQEECWDHGRMKRGKQLPRGDGLPMYLGCVISTLLLSGNDSAQSAEITYESIKDTLFDLRLVARNPQTFLRPLILDEHTVQSKLRLPVDAFYGRQSEVSMLLRALNSVVLLGGQPMMVLVSGYPGTGKTALASQIEKPLREAGGFLIRGKFHMRSRSDSVIFSALDTFYAEIMRGDTNIQAQIARRIQTAIGTGCRVLMKSIPSLQTFMGEDCTDDNDSVWGPSASEQRWKYLLCKLIAATANEFLPIAIFLEDLQWADETTLDVIRMIVTDPETRHLLFLGNYRDNDTHFNNQLKKIMNFNQGQGVSLISIKIGPIEKECVNMLVSEALCLPPKLCQPLSSVVHSKTGGVALFVKNFLKSLNEEGLLWFNLSSRRWEFDISLIRMKEISGDVVEHMSERMTRLPRPMQSGLMVVACLGSRFDTNILRKALPYDVKFEKFIIFAVEGGFLQTISSNGFMWAHDQVQQAAYELIPDSKKESFHLLLGSRMFLRTPPEDLYEVLFTIVGNMNFGVQLIRSPEQKSEVARLNLRAGEKAISSSSFNSAAKYVMVGIKLLHEDSWERDYDLTLKLYDAASEALYVIGDFKALATIIEKPLLRARCFEDKLNTYHNLVRFLAASGRLKEGIRKCIRVLYQLGEIIPEHIDNGVYMEEVQSVKQVMRNVTEEDVLALPVMTDERKLAVMHFLNHAVSSAYTCQPILSPILVFRMVRLSIMYGVCNISPFAFGLYGAWLVSALNSDFEGGYRMGIVAIELMKKCKSDEFLPRVYTTVYAFINIWKEPFQASLPKHLEAYEIGTLTGDMEYALSNLYQYATSAVYACGEDLNMLDKSIRLYIRRATQCKQEIVSKCLAVLHDFTLTLMGSNESENAEEFFEESRINAFSVCQFILYKRKHLAFLLGDMEEAATMFELCLENPIGQNGRLIQSSIGVFIDGLIALHFARKRGEQEIRWTTIAQGVIELMRQWAGNSSWNFSNKLYLLEAEYYLLKNEEVKALEKYELSIKAAHDHRFIHEEGLAFEKAAHFHLAKGRNGEALVHFTQAKKCYKQWGAHGLVSHVERTIVYLIT